MSISVKFSTYSPEDFQRVLDHYNHIKPSHHMDLEKLDRCEGGFQIALNVDELDPSDDMDANRRIKQLRWKNRRLDPMRYMGFTQEETLHLYQSLVHVFGDAFVSYDP
jgi:hypothetical protein